MSLDDLATFFLQNEKKKKKKLDFIFNSAVYQKKKKKKKKKQKKKKNRLKDISSANLSRGVLHSFCQISTSSSIQLINRVRLL